MFFFIQLVYLLLFQTTFVTAITLFVNIPRVTKGNKTKDGGLEFYIPG